MFLEKIIKRSSVPDLAELFSSSSRASLERDLLQAGLRATAGEWLSGSLVLAIVFSTVFSTAFFFSHHSLALFAASFLFSFALVFLFLLKTPFLEKKKRGVLIERQLVFSLRALAVELSSGSSFESALHSIEKDAPAPLRLEISKALAEVKNGLSMPRAIARLGERVDSQLFKRCCLQLIFAYEHGGSNPGLSKTADELSAVQKIRLKELSAQNAFFTILFVAVGCIAPALFSAYLIVGSRFLDLTFSSFEVLAAFLLVFPLLDAALLIYLREKTVLLTGGQSV